MIPKHLRIVFMGTPSFALPSFEAVSNSEEGNVPCEARCPCEVIAVVTQPDRPSGRGMTLTSSPIKNAALAKKIPIFQPERIRKEPDFIKTLSDLAPDIIIVVAFGQILPEAVLRIPRLGCINIHASLLPKYRGAAPIQWALIRGEKTTGVASMQMDVGMDTGAILLQQALSIGDSETAPELSLRLSKIGAEVLLETIKQIKKGQLLPTPQPSSGATLAPLLKKEDGYIQWQASAEEIFNRYRGVFAWPTTTMFHGEERWKIVCLEIGAREGKWGMPGELLKVSERGLDVAAGIGYIIIKRLKLSGGKEISSAEYAARPLPLSKGTVFHKTYFHKT
jgi:methionyl-tRNA formyltransferase